MLKLFLLIMILGTLNGFKSDSSKLFEMVMDRFEIVSEVKSMAELMLKVRKVNKTRAFVGSFNVYQQIGNDFTVEIKTLKKQGNEYRYMIYGMPPAPFCDLCSRDKFCWPDVAKNSGLPENIAEECPIKIANYTINGFSCDFSTAPKVFSSGDYAFEMVNSKNGIVNGVYRFYGTITNI